MKLLQQDLSKHSEHFLHSQLQLATSMIERITQNRERWHMPDWDEEHIQWAWVRIEEANRALNDRQRQD